MASTNLTVLLALRRAAEEEAKGVLAEAVSALGRAEGEQARLEALVKQAEQALTAEPGGSPTRAAEGLARERFHRRLLSERDQAQTQAEQHREGTLARARQAEAVAVESLRHTTLERQAVERLWQRQQAEQRKLAERRDEQRDEDWTQAVHQRKPR